jgi:hypothetical protein
MVSVFGFQIGALQLAALGALAVVFVLSGTAKNRGGIRNTLPIVGRAVPVIAAAAVIYLGASATGGLFGLNNRQLAVGVAVLLVLIYVVATSQEELSVPFWLTFVPLVVIAVQFLIPDLVADAFEPVLVAIGADSIGPLDGVELFVWGLIGTVAYYVIQARAGSGSNNADTIAGKVIGTGRDGGKGSLTKLASEYVTIGRLIVGFGVALVAILASQGGQLSAEAASFAADAPVVLSNLVAGVAGFFAVGGSAPDYLAWIPGLTEIGGWFASLSPTAYLFLVLLVLAVGYGAREQLEDFEERFARERAKRRAAEADAEDD